MNKDRKNIIHRLEKKEREKKKRNKELIHCAVSVALIYYHPFVDRLVRIRN